MNRNTQSILAIVACVGLQAGALAPDAKPAASAPAQPIAPALRQSAPDASAVAAKAIAYLRSQQDPKSGGWSVNEKGPTFPAITGLVVNGMLLDPAIKQDDAAVQNG